MLDLKGEPALGNDRRTQVGNRLLHDHGLPGPAPARWARITPAGRARITPAGRAGVAPAGRAGIAPAGWARIAPAYLSTAHLKLWHACSPYLTGWVCGNKRLKSGSARKSFKSGQLSTSLSWSAVDFSRTPRASFRKIGS